MLLNNAWEQNEIMTFQQRVAERLLARADSTTSQPIGIRNNGWPHDVYPRCLRGGRLLVSRKISLETAERLSLAIVLRCNRDLMQTSNR